MYKRDRYEAVVTENPNLGISEIVKIISREWRETVSAEIKESYKQKYEENKEKYLQEMADYVKKYGKPELARKLGQDQDTPGQQLFADVRTAEDQPEVSKNFTKMKSNFLAC